MPVSNQSGFAFYGVARKPIPGALQYVEEVKVCMIRETPTLRAKLDSPELAYEFGKTPWRPRLGSMSQRSSWSR
jgi:hypothetical protein